MESSYELTCDLALLAAEIGQTLGKNHSSANLVDRTCFAGGDSTCQIDTYQVYELNRGACITINVYFFRPELTQDALRVKVSLLSPLPYLGGSSMKINKLQKEINRVIRARMT